MKIGLVGLPQVGKTTVFNLLTHGHAETSTWGSRGEANLGLTRVPDPRLDKLAEIFQPKKVTRTTIEYVDIPGITRGEEKAPLDGHEPVPAATLNSLKNVDALAHIVRAFEDDTIPHSEGAVEPARDIELFELEMICSDLAVVERRLARLTKDLKKMKNAELEFEYEMLNRFRMALEQERPLRDLSLSDGENKVARGFTFLSAKPLLVVMNLDDKDSTKVRDVVADLSWRSRRRRKRFVSAPSAGRLSPKSTHCRRKTLKCS